jgi:hypothetical protein
VLQPRGSRYTSLIPLAALFAAVAILFGRVLFTSVYVLPWDFRGFHLPMAMTVFDAMKGNGSVLWDTTTYCGRPLFADPQAQVFYPPTDIAIWIATFFGSSRLAYILEWEFVLHVFAAGAFTYLLLRRFGVSRPAALCGGLVFEVGGFFASQAQHIGTVAAAAWMPLIWVAVWELRKAFAGVWFGVLCFASAMAVLVGCSPMTAMALGSGALLSVLLVVSGEARFRGLWSVVAGLALSVAMSAIMLLPAIQLTSLSVGKYRSDWVDGAGFPFSILWSLLRPPSRETVCDLIYCGVAGLFLAAIAVFPRDSRKLAITMLSFTLLAGVWMFGTATLPGRVLWNVLPTVLRGSLYAYYAMAPFCLGVAVLAGIGLDGIKRLSNLHKYGIALLVVADILAVNWGRPMTASDVRQEPGITREQVDGSPATLMALQRLTQGTPPARTDTHRGSALLTTTPPLSQIPSANGYNPLALERFIQARLAFASGHRWGTWYEVENPWSPMVDLLNIRYLFSNDPKVDLTAGPEKYTLRAVFPGFRVFENTSVLPRFFLVHQVRLVHTPQEAFSSVQRPDFKPSSLAIVEEQPATNEASLRALQADVSPVKMQDAPAERVEVSYYRPREINLAAQASAPGFLVTSETAYPGWRAWIDGGEVPLYMTNGAFRGVYVDAGKHTVRFVFSPVIQYAGAAITLLSTCIALFLALTSSR